jgi:hypothetical protein
VRRPPASVIAAGAFCAALTGCALAAATLASYDTAPSGLEVHDERLRRALATGATDSTIRRVRRKGDWSPDDRLLGLLYEGSVAYYAGRYDESARVLDRAAAMAEDRYTKSLSKEALSIVTNDRALPWVPGETELLFIHYYGMLDYTRRGMPDEAAVEARQLSALLQRFADQGDATDAGTRAALHYLAGAVFEADGEATDADVAYRIARAIGDSLVPAARPAPATGRRTAAPPTGDVLVVVEDGFVAHRVDLSVYLAFAGGDAAAFATSGERSRSAALGLSARVVNELASVEGNGLYYTGTNSLYLGGAKRGDDDYLLKLSWPVYRRPTRRVPAAVVVVDDSLSDGVRLAGDVTEAAIGDYRRIQARVISRSIVRAAAKYAAAKVAQKKVEKKHGEEAGWLAKLAVNAVGAVMERADTRSWHLLPDRVGLVRLTLPAGPHTLWVSPAGGAGGVRPGVAGDATVGARVPLGTVEVRPGTVTIVSARLWR